MDTVSIYMIIIWELVLLNQICPWLQFAIKIIEKEFLREIGRQLARYTFKHIFDFDHPINVQNFFIYRQ